MDDNNFDYDDKITSWEKAFERIKTPFEEFIQDESTSGLLLIICTITAMVLANSALSHWYESFLQTRITIRVGPYALSHTVHYWINDALMTLFFLVVGLEIKREILVGHLSELRQAAFPIAGAIGGMVVPALIYFAFNNSGEMAKGWAIPMATDIAFAIGVLVLLGNRIPKALMGFLLTVAIVDDLGAVIVIALFYTDTIIWSALLIAVLFFAILLLFNLIGIRSPWPYFIVGFFLWMAMMESGIHATMAGILTAITVPARSKCTPQIFSEYSRKLLNRFDETQKSGKSIMEDSKQRAILQGLETFVHSMESPLQRLEHSLHLWVSFLIIPLFAFANAGIPIELSNLGQTLVHPVTLGIMSGLVLGKFIGIFGTCWLMLKIGNSSLPKGVSIKQLAGVSFLAGIGFTMSIFVGELAFAGQQNILLKVKTGIIIASLLAGGIGFIWLYKTGNKES